MSAGESSSGRWPTGPLWVGLCLSILLVLAAAALLLGQRYPGLVPFLQGSAALSASLALLTLVWAALLGAFVAFVVRFSRHLATPHQGRGENGVSQEGKEPHGFGEKTSIPR